MKRFYYCILPIALAVSCDPASTEVETPSDNDKIVFSFSTDTEFLEPGDSLGIYCEQSSSVPDYNLQYIVQSMDDGGSAIATGDMKWGADGESHTFYAYHPYEKVKAADPAEVRFSIDNVQNNSKECYKKNTILTGIPVDVAHSGSTANEPVRFGMIYRTAILGFNVTMIEADSVNEIEICSKNTGIKPFATSATIDITDDKSMPEYSSFEESLKITANAPGQLQPENVFSMDMVIFPADMTETEYVVKIRMGSGKTFIWQGGSADEVWTAGGRYLVDIDLNDATVEGAEDSNKVVTETFDEFLNGTFTGQNGWDIINMNPDAADRTASIAKSWSTNVIRFNAAGGKSSNYDVWVISPCLDLDTEYKNLKFSLNSKNCGSHSGFRVYLSEGKDTESLQSAIEITGLAEIPYEESDILARNVTSEIDLSSYDGNKYVAFRYTAQDGNNAAYYELDNFFFGCFPSPSSDTEGPIEYGSEGVQDAVINVYAQDGQSWEAASDCDWITFEQTANTGTGELRYSIGLNSGAFREGRIIISSEFCNDLVITVRQEAAGISPQDFNMTWNMSGIPSKPAEEGGYGISPMLPTHVSHEDLVTIGSLTRTGMTTTGKTPQAGSWGGNGIEVNGQEKPAAPAAYAYFSVSPKEGHTLSFTSLDWNYLKSGKDNEGAYKTVLQYSLDGETYHDIKEYTVSGAVKTEQPQAELSSITELQNIPYGTTVIFRFVPYGATLSGQNWYIAYISDDAPGLAIKGIIK